MAHADQTEKVQQEIEEEEAFLDWLFGPREEVPPGACRCGCFECDIGNHHRCQHSGTLCRVYDV